MVRFVRVSENVVFGLTSKEDDLLNRRRSTKKIKEDLKTYMDGVSISFADKLLQLVGGSEFVDNYWTLSSLEFMFMIIIIEFELLDNYFVLWTFSLSL